MKVSKDQHLKAERKCLSTAAAEWSVTRDQTPGTIWGYHTSTFFLKILANMYRERKTWSSRKFGESNFFFAKMAFSRWKYLEQPSCLISSTDSKDYIENFWCCAAANGSQGWCAQHLVTSRQCFLNLIMVSLVSIYKFWHMFLTWNSRECKCMVMMYMQ